MNNYVFNFDGFDLAINESLSKAREQYLSKGYIDADRFNHLVAADKSRNHKSLPKLVEFFLKYEDDNSESADYSVDTASDIVSDIFNKFAELSESGYITEKDINKYTDLKQLQGVVEKAEHARELKKQHKTKKNSVYDQMIDSGEAELVHDDADLLIVKPHSYDACKLFGKGSKWCITMTDTTDHYVRHFNTNRETFYFMEIRSDEMKKKLSIDILYRISPDGTRIKVKKPEAWDQSILTKLDTKMHDTKNPFPIYFITADGRRFKLKDRKKVYEEYWIFELTEPIQAAYVEKTPTGAGLIVDTSLFKMAVQVGKDSKLMAVWDGADYDHNAYKFLQQIGFTIDEIRAEDKSGDDVQDDLDLAEL